MAKVQTFEVRTSKQTEFVDITRHVQEVVQGANMQDGLCWAFVPHTTAGITINENADPSVVRDILMSLDKLVPSQDRYQHSEGNAPAHIKASLVGSSVMALVESGKLLLGTWQGIYLCEFDGPRIRKVRVKVLEGER